MSRMRRLQKLKTDLQLLETELKQAYAAITDRNADTDKVNSMLMALANSIAKLETQLQHEQLRMKEVDRKPRQRHSA
jgi:septal ring factor EnvC (AmiA/AmiB activator)